MDFVSQWRGKRVLVTGGTGFIGAHVVQLGLQGGVEIHNLSTRPHPDARVFHHTVDLCDVERVRQIIAHIQPQAILHLAAGGVNYSTGDMNRLLQISVMGLQTMLECVAAFNDPPRVVLAGSWFEYASQDRPLVESDPTLAWSNYTAAKLAANVVASYYAREMTITSLRLFSVYGPGEQLPRLAPYIIENARARKPVEVTPCEQIRDYIYVLDAARAFWAALALQHRQLQFINIGSGKPVKLRTFVEILVQCLRKHGLQPDIVFGAKPYREGETMFAAAETLQMRTLLGWQPETSLETGLEMMVTEMLGASA